MKEKPRMILVGGSGFLGRLLVGHFSTSWNIVVISRRTQDIPGAYSLVWPEDDKELGQWLNGSEVVINLAGRSVDCRYTPRNKAEIISSRVDTTRRVSKVISGLSKPPALWLNASSATIYAASYERPNTEATGQIGTGFSVGVCLAWEKGLFEQEHPRTRKVAMRISFVLDSHGGALPVMKRLTRMGFGGAQGGGLQYISWIHREDFLRAVEFLIHSDLSGPVNITAPEPLPNREFMKLLRQRLHRPGLPMPGWLLEMGARIIGTETELILKSRKVLPARLQEAGFSFRYPDAVTALDDLIG